jgi:hypothetical protein
MILSSEIEKTLDRYQAAVSLKPPIAAISNFFAEVYSGNNQLQTLYDLQKWHELK